MSVRTRLVVAIVLGAVAVVVSASSLIFDVGLGGLGILLGLAGITFTASTWGKR